MFKSAIKEYRYIRNRREALQLINKEFEQLKVITSHLYIESIRMIHYFYTIHIKAYYPKEISV